MRTLALRGGARVTVAAAQWCDPFGVVTRGRVQLELRDGEPGPVLGPDAGFWLRGTGVRAFVEPPAVPRRGCASSPPGQNRHTPANTPPHLSYRTMEEQHEQHE